MGTAPRSPAVRRYDEDDVEEPERLHTEGLALARGRLRDLKHLHVLVTLEQTTWILIAQGAPSAARPGTRLRRG